MGDQSAKVAFICFRTMPLISLSKMSDGQLVPGGVSGNRTWEEQHSSLGSSSSPCTAAVHNVKSPFFAGADAKRGTF